MIRHGNDNYIINKEKNNVFYSFKSDDRFIISDVNKEKNSIIVETESLSDMVIKIISNDKKTDLTDDCPIGAFFTASGSLACHGISADGSDSSLFNDEFERVASLSSKITEIEKGTFAIDNTDDAGMGGVTFYKDYKKIASVDCKTLRRTINIYDPNINYVLMPLDAPGCPNEGASIKKYEYYDTDGKRAIDESYSDAGDFDNNHKAVVSTDDISKKHLINEKGESVSEEYYSISGVDFSDKMFYIAKNKDDKSFDILDQDGKKLHHIEFKNEDYISSLIIVNSKHYLVYDRMIVDIDDGAITLETDDKLKSDEHYISVSNSKTTSYYTYGGKKFHTKKK